VDAVTLHTQYSDGTGSKQADWQACTRPMRFALTRNSAKPGSTRTWQALVRRGLATLEPGGYNAQLTRHGDELVAWARQSGRWRS
jgi:hypothetical protein